MSMSPAKLLPLGFALVALTISACAPVANYPNRGDRVVSNDPNLAPMPAVVAEALRHCILLYPVQGDYLINLPQGQSRKQAMWIRSQINDDHAHVVEPGNTGLPAYHVDSVLVRGSDADVEILCPVWRPGTSLDSPAYEREYRRVLIRLKGAFNDWGADSVRSWPPRLMDTPPQLYGWE
ncbi:MAG: hypothetical protein KDA21_04855 [Phycisphaerales bacterium]|nr:hypothetical protein [Phycisphaerales bacterium]